MNQGINLIQSGGIAGDLSPSPRRSPVHNHQSTRYESSPASLVGGPTEEDSRISIPSSSAMGNPLPPTPQTLSSSSPLSSSPPLSTEYSTSRQIQTPPSSYHNHNNIYQPAKQFSSGPSLRVPPGHVPKNGMNGIVDGGTVLGGMATAVVAPPLPSFPWTVGSTDGSFAAMTVMQRQREEQQIQEIEATGVEDRNLNLLNNNTSGDHASKNGPGGATIGAAGEANSTTNNTNTESSFKNDNTLVALATIQAGRSLYHDSIFHQSSSSVDSILTSTCDVMGFDIAEMWLRTGPKTHQLTNSHLRPTALEDSVRNDLVEVYYGEKSNERTHRLSPALCKRAKDANDVVWVTAYTKHGAEALRISISNVRTAVTKRPIPILPLYSSPFDGTISVFDCVGILVVFVVPLVWFGLVWFVFLNFDFHFFFFVWC
jgi:hypothetical protein